jgi:CRP-like cAMP-binding protein
MNGATAFLSQVPILAGVDEGTRREIAAQARKRAFRAGEMIVLAGDAARAIYLVAKGRVRSQRCSIEGREYVLRDLRPGEGFNMASVLDGGINLATVTAVTDGALYAVPAAAFRRIVAEHPALSLALLAHLTRRVRHLSDAVEGLALYDVRIRLARCLLGHVAGDQGQDTGWPCPRHLTQGDLAAQIGTVRDVVGRTLRSFTQQGLIRRERGRVVVTDLDGLQREALLQHGA